MIFPKQKFNMRGVSLSALVLVLILVSGALGQGIEVHPALGHRTPGYLSIFQQQIYPGGPDTVSFDFEESIEGWDFILPPDSIRVQRVCSDNCAFCWSLEETPRPHYFIYPWMEEPGTLRWVPAFKGFYNDECDQEWQVKGISAPVDENWRCLRRFEVRLVNRIDRSVWARLGYRLEGRETFSWPGDTSDWVLLQKDQWITIGYDDPGPGVLDNVAELAIMLGGWYAVGDVFIDKVEGVSFYSPEVDLRPPYVSPITAGETGTIYARADVEGDMIPTYTTGPLPDNATFETYWDHYSNSLVGRLTFSPSAEQIGEHEITFYASACQSVDSETVVVTVIDSLAPPVLDSIGPKSVDEMHRLEFSVYASDPNGDRVTLSASELPENAGFYAGVSGSGRFVFVPTPEQVGEHQVTFYASDGQASDSEVVVITVNDVNLPPFVFEDGHRTIYENDTLVYTINSFDSDGTVPFLFAFLSGADTLATNMTFVDNRDLTGTLTFIPDSTQGGHYNAPNDFYVYFRAVDEKDPALFQNSATITLAVLDPNVPPEFDKVTPRQMYEGDTLLTVIETSDENGDSVVISAPILPSWSSLTDNGDGTGTIVSTPGYDAAGYHWVHLRASDGIDPANLTFQFRVYNANRSPRFLTTFEDVTLVEQDYYEIDIEAVDPDEEALTIVGLNLPVGAGLTDDGDGTATFSFTSDFDLVGQQFPIMLEVSDGDLVDQAEFTVSVENLPLTIGQTGGGADILIDSFIVISFNELIDESTVADNVSVNSAQGSVLSVTPIVQNEVSSLMIQPSAGFFAQADTLNIEISTGIQDRAGFPLTAPYAGTFMTGAGVYPGDTDNNGVVDERDILPIGLYFEKAGPARAEPGTIFELTPVHLNDGSSAWTPMPAVYADADGSGVIDADDVCAVTDNWLLSIFGDSSGAGTQQRLNTVISSLKGEAIGAILEGLADCPDSPGKSALVEALGEFSEVDDIDALPTDYQLGQNYPNPFNPTTNIEYALPVGGRVTLTIYNVMGQRVAILVDGHVPAGYHQVTWDGHGFGGGRVASGVYLYRLEAGSTVLTKRMLLLK